METSAGLVYQFGPFTVDTGTGELLKQGKRIRLQEQPFRLLVILLESSGEVVSRADIQSRIWEGNTFVDFDSGLRVAVGKLRTALGDDAANPRYIETVPKRGYRFLGPVALSTAIEPAKQEETPIDPPYFRPRISVTGWAFAGAGLLLACLVAGVFLFRLRSREVLTEKDFVVVADFTNTTGDPLFDDTLRQGLEVELEQSPFLSLTSEERTQQILLQMGRPTDARLTPEIALEVCERTGGAAVIEGSISRLGSLYVMGVRAKNCRTLGVFYQHQVQVARKEDLLHALSGMASNFRRRTGESLATVTEHGKPLEEATTPSLEALRAYSIALRMQYSNGSASAIPLLKRALELDPGFATAYAYLGRLYGDVGEFKLSAESTTKGYELRARASDAERFFIVAHYQIAVTGDLEKAAQTCETWAATYPREKGGHGFRGGIVYPVLGMFDQGVIESKAVIELDPDFPFGYSMLASNYLSLNQWQQAENTLQMASDRHVDSPDFPVLRYDLAFLKGDRGEMERQAALGEKIPGADDWINNQQALVLAYSGHLADAHKRTQRAVEIALEHGQPERAAQFQAGASVREALLGENDAARRNAAAALALSKGRDVQYGVALAYALIGDNARAAVMTDDLAQRYAEDTAVRFSYLPTLRARLALNHGDPAKAIAALEAAGPHELGLPPSDFLAQFGALYPVYLRGAAYLDARQGKEAAAAMQEILDHPGIVIGDTIGALAHLQLARAYVLTGDTLKAKAAYNDFLTLWKNADSGIPGLKEAKAEYAKLP